MATAVHNGHDSRPAARGDEPTALDLAAYLDRLDRHREHLIDDIRAARVRLAWAIHEQRARHALTAADARLLEAVGILTDTTHPADDRDLIHRRREQLAALDRLRTLTEHARQTAPDAR